MATVLVAGGAGFIGSHLIDVLIARGDHVVCVDDLSSGTLQNTRLHAGDDHYEFVEADVCCDDLEGAVRGARNRRFDAVIHLASPASPPVFLARPIATLDVGSLGTRRLLEIARADSSRFLLASTSEVYGDPLVHPQPESYTGNVNPVSERAVYDEAKRFAEALTMAYARTYGLAVRIARIFNTYGPRMQAADGRVVTNFVYQALAGEPLTIFGDGTQTRSFCHVDDEVAGLVALLDSDVTGPINIGNPHELTIGEFAELVIELTGSRSQLAYRPLPSDDPHVRRPDISLARELLGWEPTIELRDGLRRTIDAYRADRSP
jgi:nucleoside-diphosphate-sugar epimerase